MGLRNTIGEYLSYPRLLWLLLRANRGIQPVKMSYGSDKHQYFLCFFPEVVRSDKTIVYIHGGGWRNGEPEIFRFIGNSFSRLGYNTVLLGYGLVPKNKYPSMENDIFDGFCAAMKFLRDKGINTDKVIVVGSSAGGHLGGVLVYNRHMHEMKGINQKIFKGFCSLGGPLVFEECRNPTIRRLLGGLFPKDYDRNSGDPYQLLQGDEKIPVLCIHSERDPLCEPANSTRFIEKVNSIDIGMGKYYIEKDKRLFHSNLVAGMFLENMSATRLLYEWIENL